MPTYSESDFIMPALEIIGANPDGIATADLLRQLRHRLRPTGDDLTLLANRQDDKFSQKVRNLKSHDTLEKKGFATFSNGEYQITAKGLRFLADNEGVESSLRTQGDSLSGNERMLWTTTTRASL